MNHWITGNTQLICLIGHPVSHSISPAIHNAAFFHLGLDYAYLAFDVREDKLEVGINALRTLNVKGFNVTMPHKQAVLPLLDEVMPEAQMIGAVNMVLHENGRLIGYNTDGIGYVQALAEEGISISGKRIVIAGAGGGARSVAIRLALEGVPEIVILNRTLDKAEEICSMIRKNVPSCKAEAVPLTERGLSQQLMEADIFVNSTALGMHPYEDKSIIEDPRMLHRELVVTDLIYNPRKTKLLQMAEEAGCKAVNGLGMLIRQGAAAFKIWTGVDMPVEALLFDRK